MKIEILRYRKWDQTNGAYVEPSDFATREYIARIRAEGRSIIYSADYSRMSKLLSFLMEDCCNGNPEICAPLAKIASRAACCA
jgi:hypothetical protein